MGIIKYNGRINRDLMGDIGEVDYSLTYSNGVSRRNIL